MAKRSTAPASVEVEVTEEGQTDPFAHIRATLNIVAGDGTSVVCDHGNFRKGFKVAPLAREVNVPQIQLSRYMLGDGDLGRKNLGRVITFLKGKSLTAEQRKALAEVASL